ncbi:MAG: hypothetical protein O2975_05865 [Proteobacteria bacterium]|nr:hypothetical protein [Pseudomonadota bacterium]
MKPIPLSIALAVACLLSACATYSPQSLPEGASFQDAIEAMGPPTAETALPNGGRRVEFARGPMGRHTYMVDFDAQGRLLGWEQVLTEARFNTIRSGMTAAEVHALIGHSFLKRGIAKENQVVWAYRFPSPFCMLFEIGMNAAESEVVDTSYGQDPACDPPFRVNSMRHARPGARLFAWWPSR